MKSGKFATKVSVFLVLLFIAGLIPVALISRYDYPCADDFGFSAYSHIAWLESRSVFAVLGGAVRTVIERWSGWQGTFSSIFVMALQPGIWGERFYGLVPWIMIGAMSSSTLYFLHVVLRKTVRTGRSIFLCISMLYLTFALECMIDKTQAFFWFNGAAHYMIPHSVALVLAGMLIRHLTERPSASGRPYFRSGLKRAVRFLLICLASVFVGGSNYITALIIAVLFLAAFVLLLFFRKKKEAGLLAVPMALFFAAFFLNVLAPGNSVRQAEMLNRPGVVKSILLSFYYCVEYITELWFDWTWLLFVLALLPFILEAAKTAAGRFSFPCSEGLRLPEDLWYTVLNRKLQNRICCDTERNTKRGERSMEKEYIQQAADAARELMETADMKPGQILVVGCSSSEVESYRLGTHSSEETGKEIFDAIYAETQKRGVFLAAQCCEHLNRALVLEREAADRYGYEPVSVVPWKKGGGAFATAAFYGMKDTVVVEHIRAHAGMDIGDVLIGMHLRDVAVPVRLSISSVGNAHLVCARTRPKYIGGERAHYE